MQTNMYKQYQDDPERAALMRRQMMIEELKQQALQPTQQAAPGVIDVAGPTAKILQAYMASKKGKELDETEQMLNEQRQQEFASGIQQFDQASSNGGGREAIYQALQSGNPQLMEFAKAKLMQEQKGLDLKAFTPGSVVIDQNTGQPFIPGQTEGGKPAYETVELNGDLYQKTAMGLKKLDDAPKTNVTNTVNMPSPESAFNATLGRKEAERISTGIENRASGIEGLLAINEGRSLLDKGIYTGSYAKIGMGAEKLMAPFSDKDPEKAQRTEEFLAHIGNLVIPRMKDLGGSDTEEELRYMRQITAGEITVEEETLRRVLDSAEKKIRNKVGEIDKTVNAFKGRGNTLPSMDSNVLTQPPAEDDEIKIKW